MANWARTVKAAVVASALVVSGEAAAATIYGTIRQGSQPVTNAPVVLSCGGSEAATTNTDARGAYRLTTGRTGRCNLQIRGASTEVILYQDPIRYDFEIVGGGGQLSLIRR